MVIPRGKYAFQFYEKHLKLQGKTNNYKIKYSQFGKAFLLNNSDGQHMNLVVALI